MHIWCQCPGSEYLHQCHGACIQAIYYWLFRVITMAFYALNKGGNMVVLGHVVEVRKEGRDAMVTWHSTQFCKFKSFKFKHDHIVHVVMANLTCMGIGCSRTFNDSRALKTHTRSCYAYKCEAKRRLCLVSPSPPLPDALDIDNQEVNLPGPVRAPSTNGIGDIEMNEPVVSGVSIMYKPIDNLRSRENQHLCKNIALPVYQNEKHAFQLDFVTSPLLPHHQCQILQLRSQSWMMFPIYQYPNHYLTTIPILNQTPTVTISFVPITVALLHILLTNSSIWTIHSTHPIFL